VRPHPTSRKVGNAQRDRGVFSGTSEIEQEEVMTGKTQRIEQQHELRDSM
jgi:hypothetical protein